MARTLLTDRLVRGLPKKPAPKGAHYDIMDTVVPSFGVRVSDTGHCSFILVTRFPGRTNPTRRAIDECGAISLEAGRTQSAAMAPSGSARALRRKKRLKLRAAEIRATSKHVHERQEDFIAAKLPSEGGEGRRSGARSPPGIPSAVGAPYPARRLPAEVRAVVKRVAEWGKSYAAHNLLGYARRLFAWAMINKSTAWNRKRGSRETAVDHRRARSADADPQRRGDRARTGAATNDLGYPYGPSFRLLLLTGQRQSRKIGETRWCRIRSR